MLFMRDDGLLALALFSSGRKIGLFVADASLRSE